MKNSIVSTDIHKTNILKRKLTFVNVSVQFGNIWYIDMIDSKSVSRQLWIIRASLHSMIRMNLTGHEISMYDIT